MSQRGDFTNRLSHETSPYLRQHAHNPVDWYAWGPEALERARQLDRPIFLSIGYSACHWCHVMEHESFEDDEVARLLNDHFVSIKVDREERPDLDQIYMASVQLLTGQGGWPMSVFLTPDLRPFFGGTYFPPDDRYGRPGFKRLLRWLVDLWQKERGKVDEQAGAVTEHLQSVGQFEPGEGALDEGVLQRAVGHLGRRFDPMYGGFGQPPKFLHTMDLRLLLRAWKRFDLPDALHMVRHTLEKMAMGGIYDHLGGGFARYSTDARWLVPHFEKMLYDNALLVVVYLEAFQATRDPFFREVVEETLGWVEREMTSPEGPFFSTLDADSEGEEGKFYVWTQQEVEQVLSKDTADLFNAVYGVEPEGNWEDPHDHAHRPKNILNRSKTFEQCARLYKLDEGELRRRMAEARTALLQVRSQRIWPGRDEKMLTSWNALMIDALAQAAQVFDRPGYAERAAKAADFLLTRMSGADGRLFRTYSSGTAPKLNAYLEDYAYLVDALVSLYEATFIPRWIEAALDVARVMIEQFWDPENSGFYFTGRDHELLIARNKDAYDNATPSGNAMAVTGLLRLARLTGRAELQQKAEATLQLYRGLMTSSLAVGQMLVAYDFHLGPVQEFAIVGDPAAEETRRVLRAIRGRFRPNKVVALMAPTTPGADAMIPLLAGKTVQDGVTTYICQNFTCQAPLTGAAALDAALAEKP
ncbi:MAG: thioredoxin domain-containing protein [Planctomycetes bacterium]|nr:thioredoxin domain-containing protein [Planctomycetota bacterium]